ncbi:MAG: hypothetical protein GY694_21100, partial [Gammaproteobacteria bacterium]|nr:hypothetical protein [Gammaproteobacteria bacterium]
MNEKKSAETPVKLRAIESAETPARLRAIESAETPTKQEGHQIGEEDAVTRQRARHTEEVTINVGKTAEKKETETRANDKAPPEMQAESIRSTKQTEREKASQEKTTEGDAVGVIVQSSLKKETEEDVDESSEDGATHREERTTEITGYATASEIERANHDASKIEAAYATEETKRAGRPAERKRERTTSHSDEHKTKGTGDATPEHPDEVRQRERGSKNAKDEQSKGRRDASETESREERRDASEAESHNKRRDADERREFSAAISQPEETREFRCAENKYEEIVQRTTMDPETRIVATVGGGR